MFKALLKKQALEALSLFTLSNKTGKRRKPVVAIAFALLIAYAAGAFGVMAYGIAKMLCAPLVAFDLAWVYFAFMYTMAFVVGFIGSIFTVKIRVYEAKDNEALLAMPIPPWKILLARTLGLYAYTFAFCALVVIPSTVCYFVVTGFSWSALLGASCVALVMPFGALAVAFLFGWLLAWATAKLRWKNLFTALFSLAFLALYMVFYSKLNDYLSFVIANGAVVGEKMRLALYPLMQAGLAATGKWSGALSFTVIFLGAFAIAYALVAVSFLRLATMKRGGVKNAYKAGVYRQKTPFYALFVRELMRLKNPMVFLNIALGGVFSLALPIIASFNLDILNDFGLAFAGGETVALIVAVMVCLLASMNMITASSVSLEGENIWQTQVLPIKTQTVFRAKLALHLALSGVPAFVCAVAMGIILKLSAITVLALVVTACAFVLFTAVGGLAINLKLPNLRWTNELVAVKQGVSVIVAMFVGWGTIGTLVGGYFLFGKYMQSEWYMLLCAGLLSIVDGWLCVWLKRRGERIFESL